MAKSGEDDDVAPALVRVARQAESYFDEVAVYRLADIERPHWSQMSGGYGRETARMHLFAYVDCTAAVRGAVGHSGVHEECPHRIKVCVLDATCQPDAAEPATEGESANSSEVLAELSRRAGARPAASPVCPAGHSLTAWTDLCSSCGRRWEQIPDWARFGGR